MAGTNEHILGCQQTYARCSDTLALKCGTLNAPATGLGDAAHGGHIERGQQVLEPLAVQRGQTAVTDWRKVGETVLQPYEVMQWSSGDRLPAGPLTLAGWAAHRNTRRGPLGQTHGQTSKSCGSMRENLWGVGPAHHGPGRVRHGRKRVRRKRVRERRSRRHGGQRNAVLPRDGVAANQIHRQQHRRRQARQETHAQPLDRRVGKAVKKAIGVKRGPPSSKSGPGSDA
jgi:hypothetical protein